MYQVGHYHIGGHYIPHFDILFDAAGAELGDRIATLLIYLNNVEKGGGTVFNELKMRVTPVAGSGLLWYNFYKNETKDMRTLHGACPVLQGEKWVSNKVFFS